jgi:hypothetical protein
VQVVFGENKGWPTQDRQGRMNAKISSLFVLMKNTLWST